MITHLGNLTCKFRQLHYTARHSRRIIELTFFLRFSAEIIKYKTFFKPSRQFFRQFNEGLISSNTLHYSNKSNSMYSFIFEKRKIVFVDFGKFSVKLGKLMLTVINRHIHGPVMNFWQYTHIPVSARTVSHSSVYKPSFSRVLNCGGRA